MSEQSLLRHAVFLKAMVPAGRTQQRLATHLPNQRNRQIIIQFVN